MALRAALLALVCLASAEAGRAQTVMADPGVRSIGSTLKLLSFATASDGWAFDLDGKAFRTRDGGASWERAGDLETLLFGPGEQTPPWDREAPTSLVWSSPREGKLTRRKGAPLVTVDGGATWSVRTKPLPPPGAPPPTEWTLKDGHLARVRPDGVAVLTPVCTQGTGRLIAIRDGGQVVTDHRDPLWMGSTERLLFVSVDGRSWYVRDEMPWPTSRVTLLPDHVLVAEAKDGRVYRTWMGPRRDGQQLEWHESTWPDLDRADAEQARTGARSAPPFSCALTARSASLEVRAADYGCYEDDPEVPLLRLELEATSSKVEYARKDRDIRLSVPRAEGDAVIESLVRAVAPLERMGACGSTARRRVIVSWSCDGSKRREVTFDRSVCEDGPEEVKPRSADEKGYVRALEIERAIQGLRLAASR